MADEFREGVAGEFEKLSLVFAKRTDVDGKGRIADEKRIYWTDFLLATFATTLAESDLLPELRSANTIRLAENVAMRISDRLTFNSIVNRSLNPNSDPLLTYIRWRITNKAADRWLKTNEWFPEGTFRFVCMRWLPLVVPDVKPERRLVNGIGKWKVLGERAGRIAKYIRDAHPESNSTVEASPGIDELQTNIIATLRFYSNGVCDEAAEQVAIIRESNLTVNEKLHRIDAILPIPADASCERIAIFLRVKRQSVWNTQWWQENRAGKQEEQSDARLRRHRERAKESEPFDDNEDDEG